MTLIPSRADLKTLETNFNEMTRILIRGKPQSDITVPRLFSSENNLKSSGGIDEDFKRRSSMLPDSFFKNMPALIRVNYSNLTGHQMPGFTTSEKNYSAPRTYNAINSNNSDLSNMNFLAEKTAYKNSPVRVISVMESKNNFNYATFPNNNTSISSTPINTIVQDTTKELVRY
jgi:hypothetical protein